MKDVVAIKVRIGLKPNEHHLYPDWETLPLAEGGKVTDHQFMKWQYDKKYGHREEGPDSPLDMQWGMMLVSALYAQQAVALFNKSGEPPTIIIMSEAEAIDFYEDRVTAHMGEVDLDEGVLTGLNAELSLREATGVDTVKVKEDIVKALDKDNPARGVRRSKNKKWAERIKTLPQFRIVNGISID